MVRVGWELLSPASSGGLSQSHNYLVLSLLEKVWHPPHPPPPGTCIGFGVLRGHVVCSGLGRGSQRGSRGVGTRCGSSKQALYMNG